MLSLREKLNVIHGLVVCITEANKELQGYGERLEKLAGEVIYELNENPRAAKSVKPASRKGSRK